MTEKQEPPQSIIKAEGDTYEQNGNSGISHMSNSSIDDGAKVAGVIYEAPSNKAEMNPSIVNNNHITLTISSSEKNGCIPKSDSSKQTIDKDSHETPNNSLTFSVVGSIGFDDVKKLQSILRQLQKLSGDISIDIEDIQLGSIRLILKGSQEGLERLETLFKSGKLNEIEGIPVENVQFVTTNVLEDGEDIQTTEQKRLAFTIAGNLELADVAKLKAAITETSDNDEETKADKKSRLVQKIISQGAKGRNLRSADLSNADLSNAKLRGANLIGANLSNANLSNANLRSADLRGANLNNADLRDANLRDANLRGALINTKTKIDRKWRLVWEIVNQGAKGRNLRSAFLRGANLSNADLSNAHLSNADLNFVNLSNAHLSGANLSNAHLFDADLSNVNLSNAHLSNADLNFVNLSNAHLSGANLSNAHLSSANLSNADLSNTDLSNTDLNFANLNGANLSDANLSDAILSNANLSGADLNNANLRGVNVKLAQFGNNKGISKPLKQDLIRRGAIFDNSPGDRSEVLVPS